MAASKRPPPTLHEASIAGSRELASHRCSLDWHEAGEHRQPILHRQRIIRTPRRDDVTGIQDDDQSHCAAHIAADADGAGVLLNSTNWRCAGEAARCGEMSLPAGSDGDAWRTMDGDRQDAWQTLPRRWTGCLVHGSPPCKQRPTTAQARGSGILVVWLALAIMPQARAQQMCPKPSQQVCGRCPNQCVSCKAEDHNIKCPGGVPPDTSRHSPPFSLARSLSLSLCVVLSLLVALSLCRSLSLSLSICLSLVLSHTHTRAHTRTQVAFNPTHRHILPFTRSHTTHSLILSLSLAISFPISLAQSLSLPHTHIQVVFRPTHPAIHTRALFLFLSL